LHFGLPCRYWIWRRYTPAPRRGGLALGATTIGILIGVPVIVTGLLEYLEPSVVGIDIRLAARHGIRTTMAWITFTSKTLVAVLLPITTWSITLCLALDLIGCVLLVQGVFFGTRQSTSNSRNSRIVQTETRRSSSDSSKLTDGPRVRIRV